MPDDGTMGTWSKAQIDAACTISRVVTLTIGATTSSYRASSATAVVLKRRLPSR